MQDADLGIGGIIVGGRLKQWARLVQTCGSGRNLPTRFPVASRHNTRQSYGCGSENAVNRWIDATGEEEMEGRREVKGMRGERVRL